MKDYLFVCALTLFIGLTASVCTASDTPAPDCARWAQKARDEVESIPMEKRYRKVLEQIAQGCPSIPISLREAANSSLLKNGEISKRKLMDAAAPYFHPSCSKNDTIMPASWLHKRCSGEHYGDTALHNLDSATYMFGVALKKEFRKIGLDRGHANRLVDHLYLTNRQYWEKNLGKKECK